MTMAVLAEGESLASYNRKRHSVSFEKPDTPAKKVKSHSPSDKTHKWSHDDAKFVLQNFPPNQKMNWSESARTLGIPGDNAGQVLKEFAINQTWMWHLLSTVPHHKHLDFVAERNSRKEISIPNLPSLSVIANERKHLIETGDLSLGEPCTP